MAMSINAYANEKQETSLIRVNLFGVCVSKDLVKPPCGRRRATRNNRGFSRNALEVIRINTRKFVSQILLPRPTNNHFVSNLLLIAR